MEEPHFPFFSEGDETRLEHCHDCGIPLPEAGDPEVIYVRVRRPDGRVELLPACRQHWRDEQHAADPRDLC